MSDLELLPVIGKLHPSERYYAKQQADYIISQVYFYLLFIFQLISYQLYVSCSIIKGNFLHLLQADIDKDGRLTLAEMIENPYVFYSAIFSEDEDDYEYHDEFR